MSGNGQPLITVTGSTGTIGSELLQLLADAGARTRAIYRDPDKRRDAVNVRWVRADLRDLAQLEGALAGTKRLFVLTGNDPGFGALQIDLIGAAARLGVEHIVKLSALGASDHSKSSIAREHYTVEQALVDSRVAWTILRPHAFMQNWLGDAAASVRAEGVLYAPIGDGRVPFIDTRDIAAVAATVLLRPGQHVGKKYFLTGGEAVSLHDVADALADATGGSVEYRPISMDEARSRLATQGVAPGLIDAMLAIAAYQKAGGPTSIVSPNVERLLGRPPRTIREFAHDYAAAFAGPAAV